jgi:hypothetical protein
MRRSVFLEFGGFDEIRYQLPAIEDIELGTWISSAGHRILLDPEVQCRHLKRWTFFGMLKADVFQRGVPWTRLMIRAGAAAKTLNVKDSQRLSVALVYLAMAALVGAFWLPGAWLVVGALLLAIVFLNRAFYRYFASKRGWSFALRVFPLHLLYFVYCGVSVALGTLAHLRSGDASGPPPRRPLTDSRETEQGAEKLPGVSRMGLVGQRQGTRRKAMRAASSTTRDAAYAPQPPSAQGVTGSVGGGGLVGRPPRV